MRKSRKLLALFSVSTLAVTGGSVVAHHNCNIQGWWVQSACYLDGEWLFLPSGAVSGPNVPGGTVFAEAIGDVFVDAISSTWQSSGATTRQFSSTLFQCPGVPCYYYDTFNQVQIGVCFDPSKTYQDYLCVH